MQVQLRWTDVNTGQAKAPTLETPIAFGRAFQSMPATFQGEKVSRMVLDDKAIEGFHALLAEHKGQLLIADRGDRNNTLVNGTPVQTKVLKDGDRITIGPVEISLSILTPESTQESNPSPEVTPSVAETTAATSTLAPTSAPTQSPTQSPTLETEPASIGIASSVPAGFGADGTCDRKVGFLFKRRCGRTTTEGCPDCRNGQLAPDHDLYADDYAYYPSYGNYRRGYWGSEYYYNRDRYYYDPNTRNVDFNESDAASFAQEGDNDYEMDLDAS